MLAPLARLLPDPRTRPPISPLWRPAQTMAVVHETVTQIAGVSPVGFAELPGLSVTAGVVSLIEEQRATEITLGTLLPLATVEPNQLTPLSGGGSSSEPSIRSSELWEA